MNVNMQDNVIEVTKGSRTIRISARHIVYVRDVCTDFDYLYSSVAPIDGVVDFSKPAFHDVIGYDKSQVMFPSFSEPIGSTNQYIEFANLKAGETVLDLGAYSGLTSIMFSQLVGASGKVVAVEADPENYECAKVNIKNSGLDNINLVFGAMWSNNNGILFSGELNMGSAAVDIVGARGQVSKIPSFTLSVVAKKYNLEQVNFIKCDIEGAEIEIFKDSKFFNRYNPRIIIEAHNIKGQPTSKKITGILNKYGYKVNEIKQVGVRLPLLECVR